MKTFQLIAAILFFVNAIQAQEQEFTNPVKMSDHVNSPFEESNPLLSPDGKVLYFVRTNDPANAGGDTGGQDVWYSEWTGSQWSVAKNDLATINNGDNNAVVGIADQNDKLFLINTYSAHPRRDRGVVFTARSEGKWVAPRELDLVLKMKSDFYGFYVTPEEDVLLISMKGHHTLGEEDLYVSFRDADSTWSNPLHLGETVNSEGYEISPFLSADRKTLYFASDGFDGLGSTDIFKTERLDDTWENWSQPENMGKGVNSEAFDAYFSMYDDKAFFASNRSSESADLYMIGIEITEPEEEVVNVVEDKKAVEKEEVDEEAKVSEPVEEKSVQKAFNQRYVVYFAFDDASLNKASKEVLNKVVEDLRQNQVNKVVVKGHADSTGPENYNQLLSEKRAAVVAAFLKAKAVQVENLQTQGIGEDSPATSNDTREERKQNRRVEIVVE